MSDLIVTSRCEEEACLNYILDTYSTEIAKIVSLMPNESAVSVYVNVLDGDDCTKLTFSYISLEDLRQFWQYLYKEKGKEYISSCINLANIKKQLIVFCQWDFQPEFFDGCTYDDYLEERASRAVRNIGFAPRPFNWAAEQEKVVQKPAKKLTLEKNLEQDLLLWLHSKGIQADTQVLTARHRTDIWIPGKCFLELKKGRVSGDDICQAMDYCCEYKRTVVIVGNHISEMASRGIEAFNKSVNSEMLVFVSWSAVRTYLKGLLLCI